MNGTSGKNDSGTSVVLFDQSIIIDEIQPLLKNDKTKVISIDFPSYQILNENNIKQTSFDKLLKINEMKDIQKTSYELSDWFSNTNFINKLISHNVNLGSLLQTELINVLVNFIKNFYTIYKIIQNSSDSKFYCSKNYSSFFEKFAINYDILPSKEIKNKFPLDSLNTNIDLKFKNFNFKIKVGTKKLNALRTLTENVSNSLIKSKIKPGSNFFLFSEINTKKFSQLFKNMPNFTETYVVYNRRQPSVWDRESLTLFKNSGAILENEKTLKINKNLFYEENSEVKTIIKELKNHEKIFENLFVIRGISFWSHFRDTFYSLIEKRFPEYINEILLTEFLLNKYNFSGILLQNEAGPNEKIMIQIGKSKNIPILLMQHGLIFDTDDAFTMNKYQGVLGLETDFQLLWGDVDYEYRKKLGFSPEKLVKIGSPAFDDISHKKNSQSNYILLATSGPTTEDIFDLKIETIIKNIETIRTICETVKSLNQNLVIKIHPSPDEFDPTEIIKTIDPNIRVIKTGDITEIIQDCSLMIVIDFSSVILNGYILKKPIISIPVKDNGYGTPTALMNNSCKISNLEILEEMLINLIKNDNGELIKNADISRKNYITNLGNSSENLLLFLSEIKND